jgi:predicted transposase/invertase (TIGR01784 family)
MKHQIDPTVDCVFKAILGSEGNKNLLVHFLNAVLSSDLKQPITSVSILNPYNDKEHLNDKLSIVDVKARDGNDQLYQIEIQLAYYPSLPARIIYT